jgi:hypothetical protein
MLGAPIPPDFQRKMQIVALIKQAGLTVGFATIAAELVAMVAPLSWASGTYAHLGQRLLCSSGGPCYLTWECIHLARC